MRPATKILKFCITAKKEGCMTAKNKLYTAPAHPHGCNQDFFVSLRPQQRATGRCKQKNSYKPTPIV